VTKYIWMPPGILVIPIFIGAACSVERSASERIEVGLAYRLLFVYMRTMKLIACVLLARAHSSLH
jgi:hypothetical protein